MSNARTLDNLARSGMSLMNRTIQRIGILTSGGDAPGMNAAIRAAFRRLKACSKDNEVVLFREGLNGLAGRLEVNHLSEINRSDLRGIIHRGGTFIGTGRIPELKPAPADCPDPDAWEKRRQEITDVAVVNLRQLRLSGVIVLGGDGSFKGMDHIRRAYEVRYNEPLRLVGIPATIDNDIWGTDASIGFDTALNSTVDALRKLRDTCESHRRCAILEVMGNSSGWLALAAGIAGGATTLMIPERPETYDIELVLARVRAAVRLNYRSIVIVMAEGVRKSSGYKDLPDRLRELIENDDKIRQYQGGRSLETRVNIIGYIARGGQPTAADNLLASELGFEAANAVTDESLTNPVMIAIQRGQLTRVAFDEVVRNSPRLVEETSPMVTVARSLLISADQDF
ncbi:MAG: ATP-dependent 6-phosphofructokinase [Myxococcales bacterium]|nr:ATP-dependent 6-phosphofructokinase [Myxococcales bacterium]